MARVRCEKYPELKVYDLNVHFHGGVAEVKDKAAIAKLKKMEGYGFTFEKDEPEGTPPAE